MAQAIPYLAFNGNCAEAMRFYERVLGLGAKLEVMMNGADSPMAAQIPQEHAHRILHARLRFDDGSYIYAGDAPMHLPYDGMKGVTLTMSYAWTVIMPFQPTFWAKSAGMLTDRFGIAWSINGEVLI
jgi:PhnB protein